MQPKTTTLAIEYVEYLDRTQIKYVSDPELSDEEMANLLYDTADWLLAKGSKDRPELKLVK